MAVNFPNSPAINDIFTSGSSSWKWDGTKWVPLSGSAILTGDGVNILRRNGGFEIWQRGAGGSASIAGTIGVNAYTVDGWAFFCQAGQASVVSQQAGLTNGSQFCAKIQRTAGQTGVGQMSIEFPLDTDELWPLLGKYAILSFTAKAGANFSPASLNIQPSLYVGTGATPAKAASMTGVVAAIGGSNVALTTSVVKYSFTSSAVIPLTTRQMSFYVSWVPVGTAGADDSFSIDDVQLEIVPAATGYVAADFQRLNFEEQLLLCQRHFCKTFNYAMAPGFGAGANTNEMQYLASVAGALGDFGWYKWPVKMRNVPTLATYNPVTAASVQVRNISKNADCTAITSQISEDQVRILCTGTAGTVVADVLGVHLAVDAGI
jgi:hypothetical protein